MDEWHGVSHDVFDDSTDSTDSTGSVIILSLSNNQLSGEIPAELGNLAYLRNLELGGNQLSGEIPAELGNLAYLESLHLYGNQLSGEIPPELGNLAKLIRLILYESQLSGEIPPELGDLINLEGLALGTNRLSGEIPAELGDLGRNQLNGEIPPELGNLTNLESLDLRSNQLSGCVPGSLQGQLDRAYTHLGGLPFCRISEAPAATPPPTQILSERETLVLFYHATDGPNWRDNTNWLSDAPLDEWQGVSTDTAGRVVGLYLSDNQLSGEIPPQMGNLSRLIRLHLDDNRLSGAIPPELGSLANLEYLDLGRNRLSGAIPPQLGNLAYLTALDLRENRLSGAIPPQLGNLSRATALYFANNQLSGDIPPELGGLANLEWLALGGNRLSGEIPAELGRLTFLTALQLYGNRLSGCVPSGLQSQLDRKDTHLGVLPFCQGTDVSTATPPPAQTSSEREALVALYRASDGPNWRNNTNWLSDKPLDEWHGVSTDSAGSVIGLDLGNNQLSGEIPPELGSLSFLKYLYLGYNQLSGEIPPELGNLASLDWMDLDYNQLSGTIPPELGNLANLRGLSLRGNHLSGEIPPELGNLASLEALDLGGNQLRGCVPSGLQGQLNRTYTDLGGLPFCRGSDAPTQSSQQGKAPMMEYSSLEWVKERGKVTCASRNDVPGFGYLDARGNNVGFDIDLCRAVAAAVLGDSNAIEIRLITAAERGPTIQSGEVDMLVRTVTRTTSRDAQWGNYAQTMFYDGQGFIVNKSLGVDSGLDLDGASVCVTQGTTTELNLQDFSDQNGLGIESLTFEDTDAVVAAYESRQCDAFTNDRSQLAALGTALQNRDDHVILPETISEEPLGPVVPHGDDQWFDIVKMVMSILIYAEAYGIGQGNVPSAATGDTRVDRLFGLEGGFGQQSLGLSQTVAQDIVMSVGNYGESYDRHLGPSRINLPRKNGRNALWADAPCIDCPKGGQIYAAPLR